METASIKNSMYPVLETYRISEISYIKMQILKILFCEKRFSRAYIHGSKSVFERILKEFPFNEKYVLKA